MENDQADRLNQQRNQVPDPILESPLEHTSDAERSELQSNTRDAMRESVDKQLHRLNHRIAHSLQHGSPSSHNTSVLGKRIALFLILFAAATVILKWDSISIALIGPKSFPTTTDPSSSVEEQSKDKLGIDQVEPEFKKAATAVQRAAQTSKSPLVAVKSTLPKPKAVSTKRSVKTDTARSSSEKKHPNVLPTKENDKVLAKATEKSPAKADSSTSHAANTPKPDSLTSQSAPKQTTGTKVPLPAKESVPTSKTSAADSTTNAPTSPKQGIPSLSDS